jgi:hypothetical protein
VKTFRWPPDKGERLRAARGVTFEHVVIAIEGGGLLDVIEHPNRSKYPQQRVFLVQHDGYVYLVPFLEEDDHFFLKTVIPSRKAKRIYAEKTGPTS